MADAKLDHVVWHAGGTTSGAACAIGAVVVVIGAPGDQVALSRGARYREGQRWLEGTINAVDQAGAAVEVGGLLHLQQQLVVGGVSGG